MLRILSFLVLFDFIGKILTSILEDQIEILWIEAIEKRQKPLFEKNVKIMYYVKFI